MTMFSRFAIEQSRSVEGPGTRLGQVEISVVLFAAKIMRPEQLRRLYDLRAASGSFLAARLRLRQILLRIGAARHLDQANLKLRIFHASSIVRRIAVRGATKLENGNQNEDRLPRCRPALALDAAFFVGGSCGLRRKPGELRIRIYKVSP